MYLETRQPVYAAAGSPFLALYLIFPRLQEKAPTPEALKG